MDAIIEGYFTDYRSTIVNVCDKFSTELKQQKRIVIKPNLVNETPPPVTTPVKICESIVLWLREHAEAEVIIAEGSGSLDFSTMEIFKKLGYTELSEKYSIPLVDLNECETLQLADPACTFFPEFHMPCIIMESYLISVPVLKAHSLAQISGTMKNMMGCAQPEYCQADNHWKKSIFHKDMHRALTELNSYRTPDLTIMDATIGMPDHHLGGRTCNPPVNKIIAGKNSQAVDRKAAELLGKDWQMIPHLI